MQANRTQTQTRTDGRVSLRAAGRKNRKAKASGSGYDGIIAMVKLAPQSADSKKKTATTTSIVLAFASVYFFWGSTYTAIRIGAEQMPALLLAGTRFLIAGAILMAWCRGRGMRLVWPAATMLRLGLIGLLLLGVGNVALVFVEKTVPSGLASLLWAGIPLYVALVEMVLPGGEPLPAGGWLGIALGFVGLGLLVWPSLRSGLAGDRALLIALGVMVAGGISWAAGSILSRRSRLAVNSVVAATWQMLAAGAFSTLLGTALGQWPQFHVNAAAVGSLAWLITCGSLIGYTSYVYLLEHVPVAKVSSNAYVNPVVAVLLGIVLLHERPAAEEFAGMAFIVVAVFLLTTAQINAKGAVQPIEELERMPAE
jgi:drug/metabolite transporter (DMT)-like permease